MNRILTPLVSLLSYSLILGATPVHAAEDRSSFNPPPVPVNATEPLSYIQTNCSKCKQVKLAVFTTSTGADQGVLTLTYFDEAQSEFIGTLELSLRFTDGTETVVVIEGVWLTNDEDAGWVLDESPGAWSWDDVESADVGFVAG